MKRSQTLIAISKRNKNEEISIELIDAIIFLILYHSEQKTEFAIRRYY